MWYVDQSTLRPELMAMIQPATVLLLLLLLLGAMANANPEQEDCLAAHNKVRAEVGVAGLAWSDELAAYAQRYAEKQRDEHACAMVHSRGQYGENLFWGSGKRFTCVDAVQSWAKEARHYDAQANTCAPGEVCGHYTQLVWADTQNAGCAAVACHDGATFVICSYDPPGNFVGERPFPLQRRPRGASSAGAAPAAQRDGESSRGDADGERNAADAKLCQCMLNCVSASRATAK